MNLLTNLTEKESIFLTSFLANNGCGAETPEQLLGDNFSCQSTRDLIDLGYSIHEVAGYISSLEAKDVLMIEDNRGSSDPDLYWATESYLEQLNPTWNFVEEHKNLKEVA